MIDLAHVPVVDVHCHPWRNDELLARDPAGFENRITMIGMCLMSSERTGPETERQLAMLGETTPLVLVMRRRLADYLGCEPTAAGVASARHARLAADPAGYCGELLRDAGLAGLIYDEGYPQPTIPRDDFAAACGARIHRVGRIEPWISALRDDASSFAELEDAFSAEVERAAADSELVAFKSVIAYRTGLDVGAPSDADCADAFTRWRADGWRESREHAKPVRDRLLRRTLELARVHDRPLHVHCGGGDPAIVLGHARPQDMFPLLAEFDQQPVVLIHSGWPWLEEGAYVASVLPHVYLDMSITMPWGSLAIDGKLEVLLGAAPPAKVLYGSDEASEPEVLWLSAQLGREALGRVLGTAVERRWLDNADAQRIGEDVLAGNARRLHGLNA